MRIKNMLKERLGQGKPVVGPWCSIASTTVAHIIASSGMDFGILDLEHGNLTYESLENMIRAFHVENSSVIVRVSSLDEQQILKALDYSAEGVLVPHVETKEDCERAIGLCKYNPIGERGFSSFTPAGGYGLDFVKEHAVCQNDRTLTGIIIESQKGIDNLDAILEVEHLDLVYIGAYDLAQSMGFPGDPAHPSVVKVLETSIKKIKDRGVAPGGSAARNKDDLKVMLDMGMQFITYVPDVTVIFHAFREIKDDFSALINDFS